ncbi:MAG TPA: toxin-antitoxin system HicB family antitoxin [Planctomycetota bacterium]|nr:toxin-antitoxin system HicB family antitoxin [Planctomycetota bacterium]
MATLSLRVRDSLKQKVAALAEREGVSLNNYINATLAATVAQEEAMAFFDERLRGVDLSAVHRRVMGFMGRARAGKEPAAEEVERAIRGR